MNHITILLLSFYGKESEIEPSFEQNKICFNQEYSVESLPEIGTVVHRRF